jgi:hypothetical protein
VGLIVANRNGQVPSIYKVAAAFGLRLSRYLTH